MQESRLNTEVNLILHDVEALAYHFLREATYMYAFLKTVNFFISLFKATDITRNSLHV